MIKKNYSELFEFTSAQLATLKKEYEPLKGKTMSMAQINKMNSMLSRYSKDMLIKLANTDIPFLATSAKSQLVMKRGMKWSDFKTPLDMSEADELQCEACWTGYKQVGFKKKGDRRVPNCVPESVVKEMLGEVNDIRGSFSDAQLERMKQEWKNKPASALTQGVKQTIMKMDAPTRAALENAKINHISKFAGSTFEQKEEVDPSCKICEGEACECAQGEDFTEASKYLRYSDLLIQKGRMQAAKDKQGERQTDIEIEKEKKKLGITDEFVPEADLKEFKKMVVTIADPMKRAKAMDDIKRFGKKTGFRIDKMSDGKSFRIDGQGADLNKFAIDLKNFYGATVKAEETIVEFTSQQIKMAYGVANDKRYKGGNYSGAVKAIEKIARGLSQHPDVQKVLKRTNENLDEGKYTRYSDLLIQLGRMKQAKDKQGEMNTQKEIDKEKKKLGINESAAAAEIQKNNTRRDSMDYNMYKKSVELLRKKDYKALGKHIYDAETAPREYVMGVIDKKEPQAFKKMFGNQSGYYSLMKPLKMSENKEADMMFKKLSQRAQTYVNELLRTGMGTMDAIKKAKEKFNEGNMKNEEMRLRVEAIAGLKKKAEKSGMPYSILKKVYDRGMAAWKGGHRPGASQHQWAFARVNSFVTKSSGTWGGADKDLAKQVRGSK